MGNITVAEQLLNTAREMNASGLNQGAAGNVSVRLESGFLITPSGMPYDECVADDMVLMDFAGQSTSAHCRSPSSEWRFHRDILQEREDVNAVVHVHSTFATTLACLGLDVPAFHYMVAVAGGKTIRCTPYYPFGSQELSDAVMAALQDRKACLMANHGMIAVGPTLKKALALAVEVEKLCEIYTRLLSHGGGNLLNDEQMDIVLQKFASYGQFSK